MSNRDQVKNHSPANILHAWLLVSSLAADPEAPVDSLWRAYVNYKPDGVDIVVVTDSGGRLDGRSMRTGRTYKHPAVQVLTQGAANHEQEAWDVIERIETALDKLKRKTVTLQEDFQYRINSATKLSVPTALGRSPETDRPMFSLNVLLDITPCKNK